MAQGEGRHWSIWFARAGLVLGIVAVGMGVIGAIGAGQDWWGKLDGVRAIAFAFLVALLGLLVSLPTLVAYRRRGRRIMLVALAGLVLSGGYAATIGYFIGRIASVPRIHDISTDLDHPPQFTKLALRTDNLAEIPGRGQPEFAGMDATERWKRLHAAAYGDVRTLHLPVPVPRVVALAGDLARRRGWEIALSDPDNGRFEATDTVSILKFKDDVVLRVQPGPAGQSSVVDMRSVSRVGQSDLGVNAARVRSFLADLKRTAQPGA